MFGRDRARTGLHLILQEKGAIVALITKGADKHEIAETIGCHPNTVKHSTSSEGMGQEGQRKPHLNKMLCFLMQL